MKRGLIIVLFLLSLAAPSCSLQKPSDDTVVIWHWMTDRHDVFERLAAEYEQQTGGKVDFQLYAPSDIYSQKVVAAAQAGILPDIYGVLDPKRVFADFIQSGYIADLSDEFKQNNGAWAKTFFPKALAVNRFEENNFYNIPPGIYGVPIDVTNIQMLYNKELLRIAGIQHPPATFDEFLEVINALNRVGISGLVSGWGELWMVNCFALNYAMNIMGEDKVVNTYRGEVPYTDADWIKVFRVFETLAKKKALIVGIVTKINKYAEQDFALERAAFAFNGSWCVNVYHEMNPDLDYGVMLPPRVNLERPMSIWGGAGSSFVVNKSSAHKQQAIAFLKWLTAEKQQSFLSRETRNLPANRFAAGSIPDILSDFAQGMAYATHPTILPLEEDGLVRERFDKGLQAIVIGEKTPEQLARELQELKVRQMARQHRKDGR